MKSTILISMNHIRTKVGQIQMNPHKDMLSCNFKMPNQREHFRSNQESQSNPI